MKPNKITAGRKRRLLLRTEILVRDKFYDVETRADFEPAFCERDVLYDRTRSTLESPPARPVVLALTRSAGPLVDSSRLPSRFLAGRVSIDVSIHPSIVPSMVRCREMKPFSPPHNDMAGSLPVARSRNGETRSSSQKCSTNFIIVSVPMMGTFRVRSVAEKVC